MTFSIGPNSVNDYKIALEKVGGKLVLKREIVNIHTWIKKNYGSDSYVYSEVDSIVGNYHLDASPVSSENMNKIYVAILSGAIGVAENGAVWMNKFLHRAIPFITQHLVVILPGSALVGTMHEAYQIIQKNGLPSFGVFVSGPSKTADIEQSLVYGAHGPKTMTVIIE